MACLLRLHEVRKPVPEWRDESWVEELKPPKNAAKTTSNDEDMFETQELTIGGADRARKAPKTAKNDHAWHDFVDLRTKACVSFKTKLDNESDIDQSGCTALPTCSRHVVNGTRCVGVSVLTNQLREMHARGGHCCNVL
jgi:hypothetical protein